MTCATLKAFIAADEQLTDIHFLVQTKARRGDQPAVHYNAARFFDHHEARFVSHLIELRGDVFENALSRSLMRLGCLIIVGGTAMLVRNAAAFIAVPVFALLLYSEIMLVRRTYLMDSSLKGYISYLGRTRRQRRDDFVRDVVEHSARIAECISR
ncbi:hypothetical protein [Geobacter sulfurreducens]|uniref:hypothetical protein n=1 Tax=Geobacter sulfurreducens TaxID=35554 RepID=UPI002B60C6B4|nr:hypothetical protein [Geobacter sulfurreducens]HML78307.1 hypothetical protein [Geobacter sulfurreducens]